MKEKSTQPINPIITSITFYDENEETFALTGDRETFISGYSNCKVTIEGQYADGTYADEVYIDQGNSTQKYKNVAKYYSGIVGWSFKNNKIIIDSFTPNYVNGTNYLINIVDNNLDMNYYGTPNSRDIYNPNTLDYFPVELTSSSSLLNGLEFVRPSELSDQLYVRFLGKFWNNNFGVASNSLTVTYRVRENNGAWSSWNSIQYNINSNIFYSNGTASNILGRSIKNPLSDDEKWNYASNYQIEIKFKDKLSETTATREITSSIPIFDCWQDSDGNKFFEVNGSLIVNSDPSFCRMNVSGAHPISSSTIVNSWNSATAMSSGGFVANTSTGRLEIPKGTRCIEVNGTIAGNGNCWASIAIYNENDQYILSHMNQSLSTLYQGAGDGNGFWISPISPNIIKLDPNLAHYVVLEVQPYNGSFSLNNGFTSGTFIQAKKIM